MNAPAREITERFTELFGLPRVDDPAASRFFQDWCRRLLTGCRVDVDRTTLPARITVVHPHPFNVPEISGIHPCP